ncbi:uncharacterized protein LOC114360515 isoform X1 [Ostrinia furnacalis]|uniref:uncharacterized protein LOC114360515 isoform X1 n=1 Tax=Ostrinia furnacalis TaxID=93504 RepID=UPI00103C3932|nr:uncharacterized protein LOC114360515 isoform X1 [Ostrinia furnacalis]
MEQLRASFLVKIALVFFLAVPLNSVTVSPDLCPTNKIAPHRRIVSWGPPSGRTFAAYYDLLAPRPPNYSLQDQASLQEDPQPDQPDDCGEIEDYDENDLSSLTPQRTRGSREDKRWFFGLFDNRPPQQLPAYRPPTTTNRPQNNPQNGGRPPGLLRPPYASGGLLSNNYYKPPYHQVPSDHLKPVHEYSDNSEVQQTYRPDVVGGPLMHIVGLTRPTVPTPNDAIRRRQEYLDSLRRQSTPPTFQTVTRRPRPRKLTNDSTVIGSFIDLFFK